MSRRSARPRARPRARHSAFTRLSVEPLEDRRLLTVVVPGYTESLYATLPSTPSGMTMDLETRTIFYADDDSTTGVLRSVATDGTVSTVTNDFTPSGAGFYPHVTTDIQFANGAVYYSDSEGYLIEIHATPGPQFGQAQSLHQFTSFGVESGIDAIGNRLYVNSGSGSSNSLWEYDLDSQTPSLKLTGLPNTDTGVEVNLATNEIFFSSYGASPNGLFRVHPDFSGFTPVTTYTASRGNFAIDPSGEYLYARNSGEIVRIPIAGGIPATFMTDLDSDAGHDLLFGPSSSGSGGSLYVANDNTIIEVAGFAGFGVPPRVVASSILQGDLIGSGTFTYTAHFDEPLLAANLDASDVVLAGSTEVFPPDLLSYDEVTGALQLQFSDLPDGAYTLTLLSGDGAFENPDGIDLDGERHSLVTVPSGDGQPGGDFAVDFTIQSGPPRVIASSIREGDVRGTDPQVYTARFSIPLDPARAVADNVLLVGESTGNVTLAGLSYDADFATLTASFPILAPDQYTLTLRGGADGWADPTGSRLDGEPHPTTTVPSGDGAEGGDFVVRFQVLAEPFLVVETDPPAGGGASASAGRITVTLNDSVNLATLDPADLTIDGIPASTIDLVDNQIVAFEFPETFTAGVYNVRIAAGAFFDDDATAVAPYAGLIEFTRDPTYLPGQIVGGVPTNQLTEPSGLVVSRQNAGVLWMHNDSGDSARVFAMNGQGELLGEYRFTGMSARDWEDIAIGPGPAPGVDYLYLADTGDNSARHDSVFIVRIPEPAVALGQVPDEFDLAGAESFELVYPDGARDVETLLVDPRSGDVVVVSKRDTLGRVYRITQADLVAGQDIPWQLAGTTSWGATNGSNGFTGAVAGDVSADGSEILIKSFDKIHRYQRGMGQTIAQAIVDVVPQELPYTVEPKGESVAFDPITGGYYTFNEAPPGPLYYYGRVPDAPLVVAENDGYTSTTDEPLVVDAADGTLANDDDPAGGPMTAFVVSGPVNGQLQAAGDGSFTYTPNAGFEGLDTFTYRTRGAGSVSNLATVEITVEASGPQVVGQYLFYNNSAWDGNGTQVSSVDGTDDAAIAPDKVALLPGGTGGFINTSGFFRGITGIMIDVAGMSNAGNLTKDDFRFRVGNNNNPSSWAAAPPPLFNIGDDVRFGAGASGSDRITLAWADVAIRNTWLEVTVLATANTGLAEPYTFYFASVAGETGQGGDDFGFADTTDQTAIRTSPTLGLNIAALDNPLDIDRSKKVDSTDRLIIRTSPVIGFGRVLPITVPGGGGGGTDGGGEVGGGGASVSASRSSARLAPAVDALFAAGASEGRPEPIAQEARRPARVRQMADPERLARRSPPESSAESVGEAAPGSWAPLARRLLPAIRDEVFRYFGGRLNEP